MTAIRIFLCVVLAAAVGLACAQVGVSPSARYKVTKRFRDRLPGLKVLGIEVKSALPNGSISDAELEKLSGFFATDLRQVRYLPVVNITAGGSETDADMILTIDITMLKAASQQERQKRIASHLRGNISLRSRTTDRELGAATIWAKGSGLNLKPNYVPATVRTFTKAIADVMK